MSEYQIVNKKDSRKISQLLAQHGEVLEPLLTMLETADASVNAAIDSIGRVGIEALLHLSARQVVGEKQPGRKRLGSEVRWHGYQKGFVSLDERKVRVERPRLRRKGRGREAEVAIPVYDVLQTNSRVVQRVLEILMSGVSTRNYHGVLPAMAESVGMSKSSVSREMIEGCEEKLRELCERRFDAMPLLVIYIDGVRFGEWHVIVADELPKDQRDIVTSQMKWAWKLKADEGEKKLKALAESLQRQWPSAAASLREGLEEMFTINRMNLTPTLRRCLETTNIIESSFSGVANKTSRVRRWRDGAMVARWAATSLLATEKHYKKVMGYRDLWQIKTHLEELDVKHGLASVRKAG